MKVWLDGRVVPLDAARVAPTDRGFTLADGLFETLRVRDDEIQYLAAHIDRLRAGAAVIGLEVPDVAFEAAMREVLAANGLGDAVIRLTLTRGSGPRGLLPPEHQRPTLLITAAPLGPPPPAARCIVSRHVRRNEYSPLSRIKSLGYLDNILARMEAERQGGEEAILLNTAGKVAEATIANLFIRRGNTILTPPLADGVLPGIMRGEVLRLGAREQSLEIEDVLSADEVFLTSSLSIRRVAAIDGHIFAETASEYLTGVVNSLLG